MAPLQWLLLFWLKVTEKWPSNRQPADEGRDVGKGHAHKKKQPMGWEHAAGFSSVSQDV